MNLRGIRGATTTTTNTVENILSATRELMETILDQNPSLQKKDIASIFFSSTKDLNAVFPAAAVREMGFNLVPLFCTQEIEVPNSLEKCIRVLIHWNTEKSQEEIQHVYLHNAVTLRRDLCQHEGGII